METLTPLYDKKMSCLFCKQTYTTKRLRSRFVKATRHDSDFCSYYESESNNPLLYYVSVCPHCGFSATEEYTPGFHPQTIPAIKEKIVNNWAGGDYTGERTLKEAINSYKLGIYSATLKQEKHIAIAGLYMRLAWIYRTQSRPGEEGRFLKLARDEYVASYMSDDFKGTSMTEIKLLYLIGETNRRIEDEQQAILYFSKVIERQNQTIEKRIIDMAKDAWQEIRNQRKQAT